MPTHANTRQRSPEHVNVLYEKGGSYTSVQLWISGTGGRAHPGESRTVLIGSYIGSRWFQCVPIVSNSRENANACQHTAEHVNVLYERGGSYTSVQLCMSGTGGRAHPRGMF